MAEVLLCLFFLTTFLGFVAGQQTNCSVPVGASLTATPGVTPWLSSSSDFAFGFQQLQGNDNFLLSIWYDKIPDKTIIWYPETSATVSRGSKVELIDQRGIVLTDPQGREVWSTSGSFSDLACGFMNDTGNFEILGNNSGKIWESFSYPADTLLPTQVMEIRGQINSKKNKTNFSRGRFQLRLLPNGNLVLNIRDIFSNFPLNPYYVSGTFDADNSTNSGYQLIFDATGYMYILRRNGQKYDLTPRDALPSGDYYHRATLDPDGLFTQYYHPKNPTGNASWAVIWSEPKEVCFNGRIGSGACGLNNVCSLDGNRPKCECPRGFSLLDSNDPNGDCNRDFSPRCDEGYAGDLFDFIELNNTNWPGTDYAHIIPTNEQSCKNSCTEDCFCAVAVFANDQCWKKALPLTNGKKTSSENVKTFLKYQKDERPLQRPPPFLKEKDQRSLVLVGSVLLGYVAPEWFRNTPVTVKVDVFSYGVLLLEIISCQKSVVFDSDKEYVEVLTDWAWDCYHEGRVDALVENDMEGLDDLERVTTFVKIGLWCVQENPSLRPTMRKVVQMLEDFEVTDPPSAQRTNGASLTATSDVKPWLSSSGEFPTTSRERYFLVIHKVTLGLFVTILARFGRVSNFQQILY
ncbi:Bulb-type lectin domain-containing protein [Cynara cardunculus var. scolymus]|uniref:Bulb-type lectin domain-containing protein n=1 Tax=Cynara cardunculus var. scolymus TaxID=59895 RepID=A0A103Y0H3_CYNCS|nr:Bulb-type lectin domain-containing protein [Cynara cardunculus var. scolymus]